MDIITLGASKTYTNQVALGIGNMRVSGTTVYFTIAQTGEEVSITLPTPEDGVSIADVSLNTNHQIVCEMSDGTSITTSPIIVGVEDIAYTTSEDGSVTNVKNALDKLFDNGGGVTESVITPNVEIGSVKASYPVGTSIEDIVRDILTEKIPPSVTLTLNPSKTLYDIVSESISSLTINASVTKNTNPISKIEYFINDTLVHSNTTATTSGAFPYIYNTTINRTAVIKVVVTDTEGLKATATKTITFVANSYYGIVDATIGTATEALVKTLNKNLKNTNDFVYSNINCEYNKVVYAYPAELGQLTQIADVKNNFSYMESFERQSLTIDGIAYYAYVLIEPVGVDGAEITFK